MNRNYYITTPIYYPWKTTYGTCLFKYRSDIFARFKRLEGYNVMFLTGTDEHGQKIQKKLKKIKKILKLLRRNI